MKKEIEDLDLGRFSKIIYKPYLILNEDGTYDYYGNLEFSGMGLNSLLEIPIRFKRVDGYFSCSNNYLTSLLGAPLEVGGDFLCWKNNLILKLCLTNISGNFYYYLYYTDIPSFSITDDVIKAIKEMAIDHKIKQLKFFEEYDKNAYEMMKKILEENDIGIGPKSKEMVEITNGYDISNLV